MEEKDRSNQADQAGKSGGAEDEADWPELAWPATLVDAEAVRTWIASTLGGGQRRLRVVGPLQVHQAKPWGVTASFAILGDEPDQAGEVIFKACLLPLFANAPALYELLTRRSPGATPALLAWAAPRAGHTWSLFAPIDGRGVEEIRTAEALVATAQAFAGIQAACAEATAEERSRLPSMPVERLPELFEAVLHYLADRQVPLWRGRGQRLARRYHLPSDAVERLAVHRTNVARWTAELLTTMALGIPSSLDHVDLHWGNAIRQSDGAVVIFDWEEATLSYPFFSLDRLLNDARELDLGEEIAWSHHAGAPPYTPNELLLRDAYLDALPWGSRADRARGFEVAMLLAPVKAAYEGLVFADALGWGSEPSLAAAWSVSRMLARWPAQGAAAS
jgi:hypothetical protein